MKAIEWSSTVAVNNHLSLGILQRASSHLLNCLSLSSQHIFKRTFFPPIFLFLQIFCQQIWSCIYNKYRLYSIFYAILVSSTLFNIYVTNLAVQQQHPSIKKPEVNHFQVVLLLRNQSVYLSLSDSRRKLLKAALKKNRDTTMKRKQLWACCEKVWMQQ